MKSWAVRAKGRVRREIDARRPDAEIRQLWALVDAYSEPGAPEVLVVGDSAMFWTSPNDPDQRSLARMISDELGGSVRVHALAGPGYNPRLVNVFLEALERCPERPKILVLPTSLLMATQAWLSHPNFSYLLEAPELRRIAEAGDRSARRLPRAGLEQWEEWDRQPAPSLFGARRTMGEVRIIINSNQQRQFSWTQPTTRWQQAIRMRHMMDLYNAEKLTPESYGVQLLTEMASYVAKLGIPSVGYISPINREVLATVLKQPAVDHVAANADVIAQAYRDAAGDGHDVVNAVFSCPGTDFGDPVHLNDRGRLHLAQLIAEGITQKGKPSE